MTELRGYMVMWLCGYVVTLLHKYLRRVSPIDKVTVTPRKQVTVTVCGYVVTQVFEEGVSH